MARLQKEDIQKVRHHAAGALHFTLQSRKRLDLRNLAKLSEEHTLYHNRPQVVGSRVS